MKKLYLILRSGILWVVCGVSFFVASTFLILMAVFIDPRKNDRPQRMLSRAVIRLAGARFQVRRSPGFDAQRTSFFISNHVNLFDPFVLYSAIPQFFRGLELESHFRIPVYGWMMKRFGNVPVPDAKTPAELKRMWKRTRAALDAGVSLAVFPEGGRTVTGRIGEFKDGVFRMAQQFGCPIVPVSIAGSFEFNNKLSWMLRPSKIVVHLHDTIETAGLHKQDIPALRERVREIIAGPINAVMDASKEATD